MAELILPPGMKKTLPEDAPVVLRVVLQFAIPNPSKGEVDLVSTEAFYDLKPEDIVPSKVLKRMAEQLRDTTVAAKKHKPKKAIAS